MIGLDFVITRITLYFDTLTETLRGGWPRVSFTLKKSLAWTEEIFQTVFAT